jgi:hypothetical protein
VSTRSRNRLAPVAAAALATLIGPAAVAQAQTLNTTIQDGRVNINRTVQYSGTTSINSTYQTGRVNINRTIQVGAGSPARAGNAGRGPGWGQARSGQRPEQGQRTGGRR